MLPGMSLAVLDTIKVHQVANVLLMEGEKVAAHTLFLGRMNDKITAKYAHNFL